MSTSKKTQLMNILQGSRQTVFNRQDIIHILNGMNSWRFSNTVKINAWGPFLFEPSVSEPRYLSRISRGVYALCGVTEWGRSMSKRYLQERITAMRLAYIAWTHQTDPRNTYHGTPATKVEVSLASITNNSVLPFSLTSTFNVRPGVMYASDDYDSNNSYGTVTITEYYPVLITGKGAYDVEYPINPIFGERAGQ